MGMSTVSVRRQRKADVPAPESAPAACAVVLADREVVVPPAAHTLAGFRAWATSEEFPERGRFSFVGGEIFIDMSPEEVETHNKVKTEVGYTIVRVNKKLKLGEYYTDGVLVTNVGANLSTEPDASFVTWETLKTGRAQKVAREGEHGQYLELEGTPDWVLEVVSKYSVRKDTRRLRERYHRAGIPEYWLIDARGEKVVFDLLVRAEADYVSEVGRGGWQTSPVFGRPFRLVRRQGQLGFWEYTLQVKGLR
jgi:Uma2 family endonuclease